MQKCTFLPGVKLTEFYVPNSVFVGPTASVEFGSFTNKFSCCNHPCPLICVQFLLTSKMLWKYVGCLKLSVTRADKVL